FSHAIRILCESEQDNEPGEVTHFQALTSALSGTVGLGNIASVPVAITLGGPGAVFWMVVAGFFGMTAKFAECYLAMKYRKENSDGTISGGPMYYIEHVFTRMRLPKLGKGFAVFFALGTIGGSLTVFHVNQAHVQFESVTGISAPLTFGIGFALIVGLVVLGGIKSIARVTEVLVPWMVGLYLLAGLIILVMHVTAIPEAVVIIIKSAFGLDAAAGGFVGAMINGIRRATYSSEAGLGSAAIAHSAAKTKEPMTQGYVALLEPFIDTVVVSTMTGIVVVVTGTYALGLEGIEITSAAFATVISWFPYLFSVAAILFGYSTSITWVYYGERGAVYLFGNDKRVILAFKIFVLMFLSIGASLELSAVINIVDSFLFAMAIPNILALYLMFPEIRRDLLAYEARIGSGVK
ncbi:MAG: alanine/glycine:cation symporter family protein, partial [Pseudomonadota bacterium]